MEWEGPVAYRRHSDDGAKFLFYYFCSEAFDLFWQKVTDMQFRNPWCWKPDLPRPHKMPKR